METTRNLAVLVTIIFAGIYGPDCPDVRLPVCGSGCYVPPIAVAKCFKDAKDAGNISECRTSSGQIGYCQ